MNKKFIISSFSVVLVCKVLEYAIRIIITLKQVITEEEQRKCEFLINAIEN